MNVFCHTETGKRDNQEDFFWAGEKTFILCDGMGGHSSGELASQETVSILAKISTGTEAKELLQEAERALCSHGDNRDTTVTGFIIEDGNLNWFHIGDTRLYCLDKNLVQLTKDMTLCQQLLESDDPRDHTAAHNWNHILNSSVAAPSAVEFGTMPEIAGTTFLLTTDGIHDILSLEEIKELLSSEDPAKALCNEAIRKGSKDNCTAIVVQL